MIDATGNVADRHNLLFYTIRQDAILIEFN